MKIGYLIGRYPAINHGYLLEEIRVLRSSGIEVEVASINLPDRPDESLTAAERQARRSTFYIKATPTWKAALILVKSALYTPAGLLRGLRGAFHMAPRTLRGLLYHLFYFVEAVLLVDWMKRSEISHVHVSFCGTVGVIATKLAPITMSLGVYGFGDVFDPIGTGLAVKVGASVFIRSVSRHLCSLLMLSCPPSEWLKLEYAPLGIDPQMFLPTRFRFDPVPFRMICVGRLSPEKGQRLLLTAADILKKGGADFVLHLVGDGPDRYALEREIAVGGLESSVILEGNADQERLLALYRSSDAFVLASLYEGIPMVLMEAMSMEIPCVAPRITGIPELIHDGLNGLLFTATDVDDLASCILRLMQSSELRRSLGLRARECITRNYSVMANAERLAAIMRRHLAEREPQFALSSTKSDHARTAAN